MSKLNPTLGEKRVGWYFIASGNDVADGVKTQCAALIDLMSAYIDLDPAIAVETMKKFEEGCALAQQMLFKIKK
jgi:hypothetical protein